MRRGAKPRILQHPEDTQLETGQPLRLAVRAEGDSPLAFQWLLDSKPLAAECQATLNVQTDVAPGSYSCQVRLLRREVCRHRRRALHSQ